MFGRECIGIFILSKFPAMSHIYTNRVRYGAGPGRVSLARSAVTRGRGEYFLGDPCPAPVRGPVSHHLLLRGPIWRMSGAGADNPKENTPSPEPFSGTGRGMGPGAGVFRGPVGPITNAILKVDFTGKLFISNILLRFFLS